MATLKEPVVLVKIIEEVVNSMVSPAGPIFYQPGRAIHILDALQRKDNSISYKDLKYPLIAMMLPVMENRTATGFYATVKIDRIVLATHTDSFDGQDFVMDKYGENGTFTKILYPLYYEFLRCLALSSHLIGTHPDTFVHRKMDNPSQQPIGEGLSDYVDTIEILGLELTLSQLKTCI
jgi:hypothetical protein